MEKTQVPTTKLTIYGIEVDSEIMQSRLPVEKVQKIQHKLREFLLRKKVTLRELQSLVGLLNFACSVVVPGRAFLRWLINLTCGINYPFHFIRLSKEVKEDLFMWQRFIENFNGKCVFLPMEWSPSSHLTLFTDASGAIGFAAVLQDQKIWFAHKWAINLMDYQIAIKELFPIVLALEIRGDHLSNKRILFRSDNKAVVDVLNSQTSRDTIILKLIRRLVLVALKYNIHFRARHIAGKENTVADLLSRFKFQEALVVAPNLARSQTTVPASLLVALQYFVGLMGQVCLRRQKHIVLKTLKVAQMEKGYSTHQRYICVNPKCLLRLKDRFSIYIDDVLFINNQKFADYLSSIHPSELEVKETTETNNSASYFDIMLSYDTDGHMNTSLYDKRDDFNFSITNFPFLSSNISSSPAYGVFISQLIRYATASTKYTDFVLRARRLSVKLLSQGYVCDRLTSSLRKFYGRYMELVIHYDVPLSRMVDNILL
ncbi:hypothetical protein FSP39_001375 [Pinctada imbricata]|uniref:RNase H type-1 domain-containing protein n=1 Tax=Pinctada imbricata TaxID=66713 RepID=A0AA89C9L0_PINIB|nr:hypothetical protein FSP39_001375 [Pinctada imbricata]